MYIGSDFFLRSKGLQDIGQFDHLVAVGSDHGGRDDGQGGCRPQSMVLGTGIFLVIRMDHADDIMKFTSPTISRSTEPIAMLWVNREKAKYIGQGEKEEVISVVDDHTRSTSHLPLALPKYKHPLHRWGWENKYHPWQRRNAFLDDIGLDRIYNHYAMWWDEWEEMLPLSPTVIYTLLLFVVLFTYMIFNPVSASATSARPASFRNQFRI